MSVAFVPGATYVRGPRKVSFYPHAAGERHRVAPGSRIPLCLRHAASHGPGAPSARGQAPRWCRKLRIALFPPELGAEDKRKPSTGAGTRRGSLAKTGSSRPSGKQSEQVSGTEMCRWTHRKTKSPARSGAGARSKGRARSQRPGCGLALQGSTGRRKGPFPEDTV